MAKNYLSDVTFTSVKFYASLTRNQARGTDPIGTDSDGNSLYVEPGAVCFVADDSGNSIFVNKRLFSGTSSSGGTGSVEITLSDLVVLQKDGVILKTLADYFNAEGTVISDSFKVVTTKTNSEGTSYQVDAVVIDSTGITINSSKVLTAKDAETLKSSILEEANAVAKEYANTAETNAKSYADSLLNSIYKFRGSVTNYADLEKIENPSSGDTYNVINAKGTPGEEGYVPAGTNYAYVAISDSTDEKYPGFWDSLGGIIDLSAYKTAVNTTAEINEALEAAKKYTDDEVSKVSGNITTINNTLTNHSARISTNTSNIETLTKNVTSVAKQLTWQ